MLQTRMLSYLFLVCGIFLLNLISPYLLKNPILLNIKKSISLTHTFAQVNIWNPKDKTLKTIIQRGKKQQLYYNQYGIYDYPFKVTSSEKSISQFLQNIDKSLAKCNWLDCSVFQNDEQQTNKNTKSEYLSKNFPHVSEQELELNHYPTNLLYDYLNLAKLQDTFLQQSIYQSKTNRLLQGWSPGEKKWLTIFGEAAAVFKYGVALGDRDGRERITSERITNGFEPAIDLRLKVEGRLGKKIKIDINYNLLESSSENTFQVQYKALQQNEFIQNITFGDIPLSFSYSEFATYNKVSKKTIGLEAKLKKGKFHFHTIATLSQTQSQIDTFIGNTKSSGLTLRDSNFIKNRYYQLEPFIYYDGLINVPIITSESYNNLQTFSSNNLTQTNPVNVDDGSLEVWLDDNDVINDISLGATPKIINGVQVGVFHILRFQQDYLFNPTSGRIIFNRQLRINDKVFVRYTRNGRSTVSSDPSSRIINQKIETFIKFSNSLNEDLNRDGEQDIVIIPDNQTNYDIYEVRGIYFLGQNNVIEEDFLVRLQNHNQTLFLLNTLGFYSIDYVNGLLIFLSREPFRNLYTDELFQDQLYSPPNTIYRESPTIQIINSYPNYFSFQIQYRRGLNFYRLSQGNIILDSVRIKINGRLIEQTKSQQNKLYAVDALSGSLHFFEKDNFRISEQDLIEVSYEYVPFSTGLGQGYIVGFRTNYIASNNFQVGGTVLYNGKFTDSSTPRIGSAPVSTLIVETDTKISFNEEEITRLLNLIPSLDLDTIPIKAEVNVEYAISFYNPNTNGIAIIDDLESSEYSFSFPIAEEDWQLSSVPSSLAFSNQCFRAPLYYKNYKQLSSQRIISTSIDGEREPERYNGTLIAGPYNVQDSHLQNKQIDLSLGYAPLSLVLDFDFGEIVDNTEISEPFIAIATRRIADDVLDFSQYRYLEFYAKLEDSTNITNGLRVMIDIGNLNEDIDGDSEYDSEEQEPPYDFTYSFSEDNGFLFNSRDDATNCGSYIVGAPISVENTDPVGNRVINTEDLNRDGFLNTEEQIIQFDSSQSYISFDTSIGSSDNIVDNSEWTLIRMYFDQNNQLFPSSVIRSIRSLRVYATPVDSSERIGTGKLLISQLRFGGTQWNIEQGKIALEETDIVINNPNAIRSALINTENNNGEYYQQSFILQERDTYEDLHGRQSDDEISQTRESTLKIQYDLQPPNTTLLYDRLFITRNYTSLDFRFYNTFNLWINVQKKQDQNDQFFTRFGSSQTDYHQCNHSIPESPGWRQLRISIHKPVNCSTVGSPNFREISFISVGIENPNTQENLSPDGGIIWVNQIYVSDVSVQQDDAYKYSMSVVITKPWFYFNPDVPVFSNFTTNYKFLTRGNLFKSLGSNSNYTQESKHELQISTDIFTFWKVSYDLFYIDSIKDKTLQAIDIRNLGSTFTRTHSIKQFFQFKNPYIPNLFLGYNYQEYTNQIPLSQELNSSEQSVEQVTHVPSFQLKQRFPSWGIINLEYVLDASTVFWQQGQVSELFDEELRNEKRENEVFKQEWEIKIHRLRIRTVHNWEQRSLVSRNYTENNTERINPFEGNFHIPFFTFSDTSVLTYRFSQFKTDIKYPKLWLFSPDIKWEVKYKENSFKDNLLNLENHDYSRLKDTNSLTSIRVGIDIDFSKILPQINILRSLRPEFSREITLNENSLPTTQYSGVYTETLGLSRTLPSLLDRTFNLFTYPFWYHFLSSGSSENNTFSNARNFIQESTFSLAPFLESNLLNQESSASYSNTITLEESINVRADWDFYNPLHLITYLNLYQKVTRTPFSLNDNSFIPAARHTARWNVQVIQKYNLMKIFNFGIYKNKSNNSFLTIDTKYTRAIEFTKNEVRNEIQPILQYNLKWRTATLPNVQSFSIRTNIQAIINRNQRYFTDPEVLSNFDLATYNANNIQDIIDNEVIRFRSQVLIVYGIELLSLKYWFSRITNFHIYKSPEYEISFEFDWQKLTDQIYVSRTNLKEYYIITNQLNLNIHSNVEGFFKILTGLERLSSFQQESDRQVPNQTLNRFILELELSAKIRF